MFFKNVSNIDRYGFCNHKTLVRISEQKSLSPNVTIATDGRFCVCQCKVVDVQTNAVITVKRVSVAD